MGAIVPCTILYLTAAMFAYKSFFNHTQAQLIQLYSFIQQGNGFIDFHWYSFGIIDCNSIIFQWKCKNPMKDGNLILYCNILVITCIVFSIPLAQYPARSAIWNLIHTLAPPSLNFPVVSFKVFSLTTIASRCSDKMNGLEMKLFRWPFTFICPGRIRLMDKRIIRTVSFSWLFGFVDR